MSLFKIDFLYHWHANLCRTLDLFSFSLFEFIQLFNTKAINYKLQATKQFKCFSDNKKWIIWRTVCYKYAENDPFKSYSNNFIKWFQPLIIPANYHIMLFT